LQPYDRVENKHTCSSGEISTGCWCCSWTICSHTTNSDYIHTYFPGKPRLCPVLETMGKSRVS